MATAPISANGSFSVVEDGIHTGVLPVATDADGDFDGYVVEQTAASGLLTINPNGNFNYTPLPNFNGSDTFTFSVVDLQGNRNVYTMTLTVTPVNDAPQWLGIPPAVTTPAAQARSVSLAGLAAFDADGDALTLTATRDDGSPLPAWLAFDAVARRFDANPGAGDIGSLLVRLRASDGTVHADTQFAWTVADLPPRSISGKVLDGAIAGARLYLDLNGNNTAELFEDTGLVSDGNGHYAGNVFGNATLIAVGGRDTGMPPASFNPLLLLAPAGATVVTPLSTLIEKLIDDHGMTASTAQQAVKTAFALPAGVDLLSFDPTAFADADATALAVQKVMSQLATVMAIVGDSAAVVAGLAVDIAASGTPDLTDAQELQTLVGVDDNGVEIWNDIVEINLGIAAATTRSALAIFAAGAATPFLPWNPQLESAPSLLASLLAPASGITIDNASVRLQYGIGSADSGAEAPSLGRYAGGITGVDIGAGLLLSSGDSTPRRHNEEEGWGTGLAAGNVDPTTGDAQLLAAARAGFPSANVLYDVTSLAFEFTVADPGLRFVQFDVVFASDEYPEFSSEESVDIAAVFVNGVNHALFDGALNRPLSVIDTNLDSGAFVNNQSGSISLEYDGISRRLAITAPVQAGVNTLKIAVGDVGDGFYDSALFIANLRAVSSGAAGLAQRFDGSEGNDTREGSSGGDQIVLYGGNDEGRGLGGADYLDGGEGDDTLIGAGGPDTLDGGPGTDFVVFNGPLSDYEFQLIGPETVRVSARGAATPVDVGSGAAGDTLVSIEQLIFTDGNRSMAAIMAPPPAPQLTSVTDDAGASVGALTPGARTDDNRPALAGTAQAGLTVIILDGSDELGRVVADGQGLWNFAPAALAEGAHSLTLRTLSGNGVQSVATTPFSLVVDAVNSAPQSADGAATLDEDQVREGNLPPASDDDGDVLTFSLLQAPAHGQVTVGSGGSYRYTPEANFNGSDSFRFQASDGRGGTASQTFTLSVLPVNDAPGGALQVSGTAQVQQVLAAQSTLSDADGLGAFSLQWLRNGAAIGGATAASYTLAGADTGATISVRASWTDGGGTVETVTSAPTVPVASNTPITGGAGNDSLPGTAGIDTILASTGDDTLLGMAGDDSLVGGAGNDLLDGGPGIDRIDGGDGFDFVRIGGSAAIVLDLVAGTAAAGGETDLLVNVEAVIGSSVADLLRGSEDPENERSDTLRGGLGDDTIDGRSGNDTAEFMGPLAGYLVTRTGPLVNDFSVVDRDASNDDEGRDTLTSVERLIFADGLLAFGARAEELARVAFVLWSPQIVNSPTLFARGLSFYDVNYSFETMSQVALQFWTHETDAQLAARLKLNSGTSRSEAQLLATMVANGGAGSVEGRAAAVREAALDAGTTAAIEASGIRTNGVVADLFVPGFGTLFGFIPG
jgi:Ca2+-binding RTX toxin-like protein